MGDDKPKRLRHLKSVTKETADDHIETLNNIRKELYKQIEQRKKTGHGRIWFGVENTLFPFAHAVIKEYEEKGYRVTTEKTLNFVTIELFED